MKKSQQNLTHRSKNLNQKAEYKSYKAKVDNLRLHNVRKLLQEGKRS